MVSLKLVNIGVSADEKVMTAGAMRTVRQATKLDGMAKSALYDTDWYG